jgi:hypothetical protein
LLENFLFSEEKRQKLIELFERKDNKKKIEKKKRKLLIC